MEIVLKKGQIKTIPIDPWHTTKISQHATATTRIYVTPSDLIYKAQFAMAQSPELHLNIYLFYIYNFLSYTNDYW